MNNNINNNNINSNNKYIYIYINFLTQKIIHKDLIKFEVFVNFNNFSCLNFEPKMS